MILPKREDALHKAMMFRVLSTIASDPDVSQSFFFKGGTCASMLGYLDRFSIDLDFDLKLKVDKNLIRKKIHILLTSLKMTIDKESRKELFFIAKYVAPNRDRNTLKVSIVDSQLKSNVYEPRFFSDIGRYLQCQTIETMFANKLVALMDRYEKYQSLAGRDLYDIHHFFLNSYMYENNVIIERRNMAPVVYLEKLRSFIETKITQKIIDQDLNYLLPTDQFRSVRKTIKRETLIFLRDEIGRLKLA